MSELEHIRPVSPKFHPSYLVREAALQTPKLPGDSPEAPFGALAGVAPAIVGAAGTKVVTGDGEPANSRALPGSSICMHVCMHACMHMYVCMYLYIYMYVYLSISLSVFTTCLADTYPKSSEFEDLQGIRFLSATRGYTKPRLDHVAFQV